MRLVDPPGGRPLGLLALSAGSLLLNVVLVANLVLGGGSSQAAVAEVAPVEAAVAEVAAEAAPAAPVDVPADVKVVHASVQHSLARTFQDNTPDEHADVVSAVYARLFFWDLDLRSDLQKGDVVQVAYTWDGALAHIPVASYESKKLGRTLHAYEFQATGDTYPSWWDDSGQEMAMRLVDGPLADYEQVTSLLKDRPKHRGMDFKVPEGAPVTSPKSGSVLRTNWNHANNGNCVEVRYNDGTVAKFLHLSRTDVKDGQSVGAGTVLGLTGNTGHSTAPHLHYELEKNGKVVDPIDYHGVVRRQLPAADQAAFDAEKARLDGILQSGAKNPAPAG
jgi:murein DD-endopeptidase